MSKIKEIWDFVSGVYLDKNLPGRFSFGVMTGDITVVSVDNYYLVVVYKNEDIGTTKLSFKISIEHNLTTFSHNYIISDIHTRDSFILAGNEDSILYIYDKLKDLIRDYKIKTVLD